MTTMTYTANDVKHCCLNTLKINGRVHYPRRITQISEANGGKWVGKASGYHFTIIGGRASGGAENEWFVQWDVDGGQRFVPVTSAAAAIRYIEQL